MMEKIHKTLLLCLLCLSTSCLIPLLCYGETIGDMGCNPDPSCYDSQYHAMDDFAGAGVTGGIPTITNVKRTLSPGENIQSAIDNGGAGVVLLNNGTYAINSTINLKDNVVLRGESKTGVILKSKITSTWSQGKRNTINFAGSVNHAGVEDLTIEYDTTSVDPIDRNDLTDGGWCGNCFQNDPGEKTDLYVRQINIDGDNNWVDNVNIFKTGTDPIQINRGANHNTIRNTFIDRCYNKGGGGNGYFDLRGDYNLVVGCTVKRIRHFAVQQGAKYNVVIKNRIEVDVNFHNGDDGYNLIETNTIYRPSWHGWGVFATGGSEWGHQRPGTNNYIVNNTTRDYTNDSTPFDDRNRIYTFTGYGSPSSTDWPMPTCGTFYAVECSGDTPPTVSIVQPTNGQSFTVGTNIIVNVDASNEGSVENVKLYLNGTFVRQINSAPYEWGKTDNLDPQLKDMPAGSYTIKAVAEDGLGLTSEQSISITVGNSTNVALKKAVTASEDDGNVPGNAIDGNTDTRWSASGYPQWLEVDLGSVMRTSKTELVCYQDRAYQFIIESKTIAGDSYTQIVDRSSNTIPGTAANPITDNFAAIDARYVRITVLGASGYTGTWVSLPEFRVFGEASSVPAPQGLQILRLKN